MDSAVKFIASLVVLDSGSISGGSLKLGPPDLPAVQSVSIEPRKHSEADLSESECPYAPAAKMVCPAQSGPTAPLGAGGPAFPTLFNLELPDLEGLDDEVW